MIRNAKEGQLLAASLAQVSFNAGNAVGAWLGGLPSSAPKFHRPFQMNRLLLLVRAYCCSHWLQSFFSRIGVRLQ